MTDILNIVLVSLLALAGSITTIILIGHIAAYITEMLND